ncbi:MAG: hypothetical protein E7394_08435 [Ruminococcaceae bacterium]|nr:hypothetical protein [Oscillospiraceae bacterium]
MTLKISKDQISKRVDVKLLEDVSTIEYDSLVLGDFAIEFDVSVTDGFISGNFEIQGGNTPATVLEFTKNGEIRTRDGRIHIADYGLEPVKIRVEYFTLKRLFDIYANGELIAKDYSADIFTKLHHITVFFDKCITFTFDVKAETEGAKIHLENVSATQIGNAPVWEKEIIPADKVWFLDDEEEKAFMKDKVSLHLRSGQTIINGEKYNLLHMPYRKNDNIFAPAEFYKLAFDISAEELSKFVFEEKDAVLYFPLYDICEKLIFKKVFLDTTSVHSGLVIISDNTIKIDDKEKLQKLNDYCFYERPTPEKWLSDYDNSPLKGIHPRIIATERDFIRLREEVKTNEYKKRWFNNLLVNCEEIMKEPILKYELRDRVRLLYVADDFMEWMTCLAFAYKMTGDRKYFDAAWKQIEAVSNMPDWNPVHHIDVGIMALGYAISYDWFYELLTGSQKQLMEKCVHNNLFWIINEAHKRPDTPYGDPGMKDNHNVLCNAGLIACVVAFMDVHPEVGSQLGAHTMGLLERFMWLFAPIGAYFEGPSYACVSINYTARLFAAMEPCMGTLYGLDKAEAFDLSADYIMNMQSDAASFGFGDGNSDLKRCSGMFWLYNHYGIKGKKDAVADLLVNATGMDAVDALLHYNVEPDKTDDNDTSGLGVYYPGEDLVLARNSFEPGQVYVGLKCGGTIHPHSHLDSGSFVFDAMGTRWAHDLGQDDYNLEWNWGFYDIYRRRPESHNTLIINPDAGYGYELDGRAKFLSYDIRPKGVIAKTDLTELYGDKVTSAKRGFFFTDDRRSLVVRDEVSLTGKSDLYWLMCISSNVEIIDEHTVILTNPANVSQKVKVEFISSTGKGTIEVGPAAPFPTSPQIPEQNQNVGYQRLSYKVSGNGNINITAKITPMGFEGSDISQYDKNMDSWVIPDGELKQVHIIL